MTISQKCQYAVRSIFELAKREGEGPIRAGAIAEAQAIPIRFLEVILNELKQGGFVVSRRGAEGGFMLARPARAISMGEVMRFIDGPFGPVKCVQAAEGEIDCPFQGDCVFLPVWESAEQAVAKIFDGTSFAELAEREQLRVQTTVSNFSI